MSPDITSISAQDKALIASLFKPFAALVDSVDLFGSRATGRSRAASDIDILVKGKIDLLGLLKLGVAFEESDLACKVDLLHERDLVDPDTRAHILQQAVPLLTKQALHNLALTSPLA